MKKVLMKGLALAFVGSLVMAGSAMALTLTQGTEILLVDGNRDNDVTLTLGSFDNSLAYDLVYSINDGANWDLLSNISVTFDGGTVLDLAITNGTDIYSLSGDAADTSYDVTMTFLGEYSPLLSQTPVISSPYYANLFLDWTVDGTTVFSNSFALTGGDGMAPVPEPATMLLFGSGLVGLAGYGRKKIKK